MQYLIQAVFSPIISTWNTAITPGFFTTWPGLTSALVCKFSPKSLATAKGHLHQDQQNVQSIRNTYPATNISKPPVMNTPPLHLQEPKVKTQMAYLQTVEYIGKVSTDQTGLFPFTYSCGSKYVMVLYDHNSNAILAEQLTSSNKHEPIRAMCVLHAYLYDRSLTPQYQMMDNECPSGLKTLLRNSSVKFQLSPPYLHRTNAAEREIQTYKDHLIASLSSCDTKSPLHLWDRLIPHANLTLNLLRPSRLNPRLSSEAQLNVAFDFNRTPLSLPCPRIVVQNTPDNRRTWALHGVDGWYLGPAPDHYRCYRVYIPLTLV